MRRRICEAAAVCLSGNGYHRTTISDVVTEAGVSTGALQHHFPTKEALVVATAEYLLGRAVKWFQRTRDELGLGKDSFAEFVRRSWRRQISTDEYGALIEILVAARTDASLQSAIAPALNDWREAIIAVQNAGSSNSVDIARQDMLLTISRCMMTGLLVHDGLLRDKPHIDNVIDQWIEIAGNAG